jgi:DNA/RNA endonuclease G (NUC1)
MKGPIAITANVTSKVNDLNIKKRPSFYRDTRIPKQFAVISKDYKNTGYDRGHLGLSDSSWDWSQDSLNATYTMANIQFQTKATNRYKFVPLERLERSLAIKYDGITSTTLVYFNDKPFIINGASVPSAFAKIYEYNNIEMCFFIINDDMNVNKDPYYYERSCASVKDMWGNSYGIAKRFGNKEALELNDLIDQFNLTGDSTYIVSFFESL